MLRAGPYRVDDVAGAISGKHRPRMGEQPTYRVKTLIDSREERSVSFGTVFRNRR